LTKKLTDARTARKSNGTTRILWHLGGVLVDNRHALIVATDLRARRYYAERDAAVAMLQTIAEEQSRRTTGAETGYDSPALVAGTRA